MGTDLSDRTAGCAIRGCGRGDVVNTKNLRELLFYGGVKAEVYRDCLPEIRRENRERLLFFLSGGIFFLLLSMVASALLKTLSGGFAAYLAALGICIGLLYAVQGFPDRHAVTAACTDLFMTAIYLLGIYLDTLSAPTERAYTFPVFIVVLPMLFPRPAVWNILHTVLYEALFVTAVLVWKDPSVYSADLLSALIFGLMSCVLSTYYIKVFTTSIVSRRQLQRIAETDLNTQLPNRNAYENRMHEYPLRCFNLLSCVYVDVNGLHELNNARGHDAGDALLKTVAQEFAQVFEREDCYRIGGDEFVAFVVDKDPREVRQMIRTFVENVERHGYSVAVGTASCSAGGIQIESLIKQAETRMYDVKEEHYRTPRH